ncbi:MAG: peptidylprolyl isomerase [Phycisphaerales bacterium]
MRPTASRSWTWPLLIGLGFLISCAGGDSDLRVERRAAPRVIAPSDFYAGTMSDDDADDTTDGEAPDEGPRIAPGIDPDDAASSEVAPNTRIIVGGLVGQVNGRPIFADAFFEPMAEEMAIMGRESASQREFVAKAWPRITQQLRRLIDNELILAEAESRLTEQQRIGIRYWLDSTRREIIRQSAGSEAAANERLQERYGTELDPQLDQIRAAQLVEMELRNKVEQNVVVSWRDIERYYREHSDEFNPPAMIQLRLIVVPMSDESARSAVKRELEEGRLFSEVATRHSRFMASDGGLMAPTPLVEGIDATPLTAWPEVDAAIRDLDEGAVAGPIDAGSNTVWAQIVNLESGEGRSLYEVQTEIETRIRDQRILQEQSKYIGELRARGSYDDLDRMALKLLDISIKRWAPEAP